MQTRECYLLSYKLSLVLFVLAYSKLAYKFSAHHIVKYLQNQMILVHVVIENTLNDTNSNVIFINFVIAFLLFYIHCKQKLELVDLTQI